MSDNIGDATKCACGAVRGRKDTCDVRLGPRVVVRVCTSGSRTDPSPKLGCIVAAVKARRTCPGCDRRRTVPGALCTECSAVLEDHRRRAEAAAEAAAEGDSQVIILPERSLSGHRDVPDSTSFAVPRDEALAFGDALRDFVLGAPTEARPVTELPRDVPWHASRVESYDRGFTATLTPFRLAALDRMFGAVRAVAVACRKSGYANGSSVLARLAQGDMSVLEFERRAERDGSGR